MKQLFNYTSKDLSKVLVESPYPYFYVDNFLKEDLFQDLNKEFNELKNNNKFKWTVGETPRVTRLNEAPGTSFCVGGGRGNNKNTFSEIITQSSLWDNFLTKIYSNEGYKYYHDIFKNSPTYNKVVTKEIYDNSSVGCKMGCNTNNYGDIIHPDNSKKVISFLLYMDNSDWDKDNTGGTQLWEVTDSEVPYDWNDNSIDSQLRKGRYSKKMHSLKEEEAEKVNCFLSIDFKPNRLVGFLRTDYSYHAILPMKLKEGITRNCFQINVWKNE